ncbi:MAG: hypothetical protein HC887_13250 [Desulfobacteraceae bacterium]|nr:hypothetical protein [Desulfobacteraceae bacterium]
MFGNAVAISGNYIVVGAPYFSSRASHEGAAYIYKLSGTTWTLQSKIMADDKLTSSEDYKYQDDRFGSSVAVSGNYIVVGAPYDADKGSNAGSVYIFQSSGAQIAKLTAGDALAGDFSAVRSAFMAITRLSERRDVMTREPAPDQYMCFILTEQHGFSRAN